MLEVIVLREKKRVAEAIHSELEWNEILLFIVWMVYVIMAALSPKLICLEKF